MGNLSAHVITGVCYFGYGLWHLFNHVKLHALHPESYTALPWFPTSKFKYLEPLLSAGLSSLGTLWFLFVVLKNNEPLKNMEHCSLFMAYFIHGAFAVSLDRAQVKAQYGLTLFLGALAYAQGFLLIHFHSTDHMGLVAQYHLFLQLLLLLCSATFLIGIGLPESFMVSFVRSLSICFLGIWLIFMGIMLWSTPALLPKGCFMQEDQKLGMGQRVVRCSGEEALHRAKSLINIQFSWFTIGIASFGVSLYLILDKIYGQKVDYYYSLGIKEDYQMDGTGDSNNAESQKC